MRYYNDKPTLMLPPHFNAFKPTTPHSTSEPEDARHIISSMFLLQETRAPMPQLPKMIQHQVHECQREIKLCPG
jgi:hypothetical protein